MMRSRNKLKKAVIIERVRNLGLIILMINKMKRSKLSILEKKRTTKTKWMTMMKIRNRIPTVDKSKIIVNNAKIGRERRMKHHLKFNKK